MKKLHFVHLFLLCVLLMTAAARFGIIPAVSAAAFFSALTIFCFYRKLISRGVMWLLLITTAVSGIQGCRHYLERNRDFTPGEYLNGEFLITDLRFVPLPDLKIRRTVSAETISGGEDLTLILPRDADQAMFRRGNVLSISGRILPERAAEAVDYRTGEIFYSDRFYPDSAMLVDECRLTGRKYVWGETFFSLRDKALALAVKNIHDGEKRNLAAALFFGVKSELSSESQLSFIRSGTIHLLSVSGLHVAMLGALLLYLLKIFPDRRRYLILTALLAVYTVSTGMNPPATRAFFMIGAYSVLKVFFLYLPGIYVLEFIAAGMILYAPENLTDMGFDYSFLITAALLLMAEKTRSLHGIINNYLSLFQGIPARRERFYCRLLTGAGFSVAVCVLAFAAGLPLSLYFQGLFVPGAVIANIMLLPVCAVLFPLLFLKIVFAALNFDIFALPLAFALGCILEIGEFCAKNFGCIPAAEISLAGLLILYFFLAGIMLFKGKWKYFSGAAAILTLAVMLLYGVHNNRPSLLVIHGGSSGIFSVIIADTASHEAIMVNVPAGSANIAEKFLRRKGIRNLSEIHFTSARSAFVSDLEKLRRYFPVNQIFTPPSPIRSRVFAGKLGECTDALSGRSSLIGLNRSPDGTITLDYANLNSGFAFSLNLPERPAGELFFSSGTKEEKLTLYAQNIPYLIEF